MKRAIAAKNYSKGGCERIGVHLDDGSHSQNTKSNSSFWQSISVSGCIFYCRYTFFDTLKARNSGLFCGTNAFEALANAGRLYMAGHRLPALPLLLYACCLRALTKNGKPCILSSDKENCRNTVGGQVLPLKGGVAYGIFNIYCDYPLCSHRLHIGNKKKISRQHSYERG